MSTLKRFVVVTGLTGAGRGTAAKALEKLGFYVIDNLPSSLLTKAVAVMQESGDIDRLAVVVDSRSRNFFGGLVDELEILRGQGVRAQILYLEARDEVLVRRQDAARRPHPLTFGGGLVDGFARERELMSRIRGRADLVIDTTNLNAHQLAQRVHAAFEDPESRGIRVSIMSFGYKYGVPIDADMVADMRFLPNPFWVDELRPQSGLDVPVRDYVLRQDRAAEFLDRYVELIMLLSDGYLHEDKSFISVGIGCTGGRHRSVAMSEALAARLRDRNMRALLIHRDLGRE